MKQKNKIEKENICGITHSCCNTRLTKEGERSKCCWEFPHEDCELRKEKQAPLEQRLDNILCVMSKNNQLPRGPIDVRVTLQSLLTQIAEEAREDGLAMLKERSYQEGLKQGIAQARAEERQRIVKLVEGFVENIRNKEVDRGINGKFYHKEDVKEYFSELLTKIKEKK